MGVSRSWRYHPDRRASPRGRGDRINLVTLFAADVDPHHFEPKAADVRKLSDAAVVLRNGIHLDEFLDKMIESNSTAVPVTVTEGITLHAPTDGDDHDDEDPHVWHDPMNAKVMVDNIAKALSAVDAANASTYAQNAMTDKEKLDATDTQIKQLIDSIPPANRKIVTNHDAFGYFIRRYNLTYVGAILSTSTQGEVSGKTWPPCKR